MEIALELRDCQRGVCYKMQLMVGVVVVTLVTAVDMKRRVVLFPSPFEGHLNPMLQVAILLHIKGFDITIVHTGVNSPEPSKYPTTFKFVPIQEDDGSSEEIKTCGEDHMAFLINLNANCEQPFRCRMKELVEEEAVACLIVDAQLYFTRKVSDELNLPRIVLRTSSAASFRLFAALPTLTKGGFYPIQDDRREDLVPDMLIPLRIKDLPNFSKSTPDSADEVLTMIVSETRASSSCVLMNTFEALEKEELEGLGNELNLPVIPIGPLHRILWPYSSSSPRQDSNISSSCLEWLDTQRPRSVLYVSHGSLACMDEKELVETALGLADSQQPFLWVIRPGSVRGSSSDLVLPKESEEATGPGERGKILSWAPQKEVLLHHAVGGFWTHCGWNSVLESVCAGVPMLCRPSFGDQLVNARVVSHVWKVGIPLENELERETIAREIRRLMVCNDGEDMRRRAGEIKLRADRCIEDGGSFQDSVEILVNRINSF